MDFCLGSSVLGMDLFYLEISQPYLHDISLGFILLNFHLSYVLRLRFVGVLCI